MRCITHTSICKILHIILDLIQYLLIIRLNIFPFLIGLNPSAIFEILKHKALSRIIVPKKDNRRQKIKNKKNKSHYFLKHNKHSKNSTDDNWYLRPNMC